MVDFALQTSFAIAMLAILNPLGKIPPWVAAVGDTAEDVRKSTALALSATAAGILVLFLWQGQTILSFFDIDMAAFRLAGGLILGSVGASLLNGQAVDETEWDDEDESKEQQIQNRFNDLLVPIAVPLLAGPGSIITATIYGVRMGDSLPDRAVGSITIVVLLGLIAALLARATAIAERVGRPTLVVQERLFGLILVAIGVQMGMEGVGSAFPGLTGDATLDSQIADDIRELEQPSEADSDG